MLPSATAEDLSFYQTVIQHNPLSIEAHRALILAGLDPSSDAHATLSTMDLEMIPYGQTFLVVPRSYQLLENRQKIPCYDTAISHIARAICTRVPHLRALDIGANIGMSVGMINLYQPIPCLSVEVEKDVFALLEYNLGLLGNHHRAVNAFIGDPKQSVVIQNGGLNGHPNGREVPTGTTGSIPSVSLDDLLSGYPEFQPARLLKVDTEGADFKVLEFAHQFIQAHHPAIFVEYSPEYAADFNAWCQQGLATIDRLIGCGYQTFMIFDNFGHLMMTLRDNLLSSFSNLHDYLYQSKNFHRVVYYYDILALPNDLADLEPLIRSSCLKKL